MDIRACLIELNFMDAGYDPASDLSDYAAMVSTWRHPSKSVPSEQDINSTWQSIELSVALSSAIESLNAKYDAACMDCSYLTYTWQADRLSLGSIVAKHHVLETSSQATVDWTDAGNVVRTLSWSDFESLKNHIYAHHEAAFARKQELRTAINAATLSELTDKNDPGYIDITTGWPT